MWNFCIFLYLLQTVFSYNLCVVGGKSGLGKELILQSLNNNNNVLALTNNSYNIELPYRGGGLDKKNVDDIIINDKLTVDIYSNSYKYNFDNIVFTLGGQPFLDDYSDVVTKNILNNVDHTLKNIILISAYGVGDSLKNSNLGIKIMNNLYLRDVYRAKNYQETIINNYGKKNNVNIIILRPKTLSYGINIYQIQSRETLANKIITSLDI